MRKIRWDKEATDSFTSAIKFIRKDSFDNAEKVRNGILLKTNGLKDNPEKCALDKFKVENDGSFRAFELYHYRVSYTITEKEIIITRVRHTKMIPLEH